MKTLRKFASAIIDNTAAALVAIGAILILYMVLMVIEPMAPLVTLALAVVGTLLTMNRWSTATASIAGLVLYAVSWPLVSNFGFAVGMAAWSLGVLIWFIAVMQSLQPPALVSCRQ